MGPGDTSGPVVGLLYGGYRSLQIGKLMYKQMEMEF